MFHFLISFRNKKAEALQSKIKQDLLCSIHPTYLFYYLFSRSELIKKTVLFMQFKSPQKTELVSTVCEEKVVLQN